MMNILTRVSRTAALAAAALMAGTLSAAALSVSIVASGIATNDDGDGINPGFLTQFGPNTPAGATWLDSDGGNDAPAVLQDFNLRGSHLSPFRGTGLNDTRGYFAVGPTLDGGTSTQGGRSNATLLFGAGGVSTIDILWASIDDWNELFVDVAGGSSQTIEGSDLRRSFQSDPAANVKNGTFSAIVRLDAAEGEAIAGLTFGSNFGTRFERNAFEFALAEDLRVSDIPVPAAGILLLGALGGLGAMARRKAARAA
ncbi:VPLPA-CTERM sorting domain-containing protein [Jannaschia sp. LMIT008]|uniref:VPLPA-CTERM sorting domain-containing protein n=1 Tax=Jannaschia maritima TaxID=3032585 RepID=UPI002811EDB2|nr:VPLPA-CTERM sorting domain-containing protein [Jannaschia sp. LMIT008]